MSVESSYSDHHDHLNHLHNKSFHRRNHSGELDVFEAANYFSSIKNDENHRSLSTLKFSKESSTTTGSKQQHWNSGGARMSLDIPTRKTESRSPESMQNILVQSQVVKERAAKINKQPSSPGGRLASFLNSLFIASKKKNKSGQDDQRQKMRRSSISHLDSKSIYSASSTATGFRTPPPYAQTRNYKSFSDSRRCIDHKQVILTLPKQVTDINNDVKLKTSFEIPPSIKTRRNSSSELVAKETVQVDKDETFEFKKADVSKDFEFKVLVQELDDDDDDGGGGASDTSSDLFELQNYDLGDFSSSELPVYETTNVDQIKKSPKPVSSK